MSTGRSHHDEHHESVATLVRSVPVRLIEVSRGGCRLECERRIESGTSGQLAVQLAGLMRVDDVRVARCQPRMGAGPVYQLGAELLRTRRLGRRTVRMAVRRIISGDRALATPSRTTRCRPPSTSGPTRWTASPAGGPRPRRRTGGPESPRAVNLGACAPDNANVGGRKNRKRKEEAMKNLIQRFIREEEGQDVIEYALLAAFISIGAIVACTAVSMLESTRTFTVVDSGLTAS